MPSGTRLFLQRIPYTITSSFLQSLLTDFLWNNKNYIKSKWKINEVMQQTKVLDSKVIHIQNDSNRDCK